MCTETDITESMFQWSRRWRIVSQKFSVLCHHKLILHFIVRKAFTIIYAVFVKKKVYVLIKCTNVNITGDYVHQCEYYWDYVHPYYWDRYKRICGWMQQQVYTQHQLLNMTSEILCSVTIIQSVFISILQEHIMINEKSYY